MNPIENPYSPGAGSPPPELVGRDGILADAKVLLGRVRQKRPEKSMLLTGLRGVGKTVLLNEIKHFALEDGYHVVSIDAYENRSLGEMIAPYMRTLLFELDRIAGAGEKVKRGLAVLRSFLGTVKVSTHDMTFGLDVFPANGIADSGDLEIDLPSLFVAIGEAADDRKTAVAIFIDEIQYFSVHELGALIAAMHKIQQMQLPIVLLGAGLPVLPGLAGEAKSYAERLFNFSVIDALQESDAAKALAEPAEEKGVKFEPTALEEIFRLTRGYPYFLQEWGYQSWNTATSSPITLETVRDATQTVIARLDQNFFRVRFDRLTTGEKNFLRAMAYLGPQAGRTGEIADVLHVKQTSLSPVRAKLLNKGMIYSPAHGELAFTVPLFDEFMVRAMPDFKSNARVIA